tara:strand:- start:5996 stop:6262 length:267 start_codon:yes stop_codon:yes gene_type:complete
MKPESFCEENADFSYLHISKKDYESKECIASLEEVEIYLDYVGFDELARLLHDIINQKITLENVRTEYFMAMNLLQVKTDKRLNTLLE